MLEFTQSALRRYETAFPTTPTLLQRKVTCTKFSQNLSVRQILNYI